MIPRSDSFNSSFGGRHEQADDEDEDDELESDADGVLEAALQAGEVDGEPYGEGEQAADRQEHAEPARDEPAHDSRRAQEQHFVDIGVPFESRADRRSPR